MKELWSRYFTERQTWGMVAIAAIVLAFVSPWGLVWKKIWDYWLGMETEGYLAMVGFLVTGAFVLLEKFNR